MVMSLDRIRQLLKQIYPIKKAFEIGEGTGNAISFALGAGTLTTIFGFIKSEPHIAMACGAIVVYYSFAVYRSVIDWFRHEDLNNVLFIGHHPTTVIPTLEGKRTVWINYIIHNIGSNKLVCQVEKDFFQIDNFCASGSIVQAPFALSPNGFIGQRSEPIRDITGKHKIAKCSLIIKYGPSADNMTHRWAVDFEPILPPPISDDVTAPLQGVNITKSVYERVGA
jgi:hypothetical protein